VNSLSIYSLLLTPLVVSSFISRVPSNLPSDSLFSLPLVPHRPPSFNFLFLLSLFYHFLFYLLFQSLASNGATV